MSIDLRAALAAAQDAALDAGKAIAMGYGVASVANSKSDKPWDAVTRFDVEAEQRITERLAQFDSSIPVRGEELGGDENADTTWLIDPIDGTMHYMRGIPFCTTMIALIDRGEVVVSVINDFVNNAIYYATRNGGAFCNDDPIRMTDRALDQSLIVAEINTKIGDNLALWSRLNASNPTLNVYACGSPFAAAAAGRLDGRVCKDPWGSDWDFAPGSLLIEEAGGIVTNIGSDTYNYKNHDFIAANARAYKDLVKLI